LAWQQKRTKEITTRVLALQRIDPPADNKAKPAADTPSSVVTGDAVPDPDEVPSPLKSEDDDDFAAKVEKSLWQSQEAADGPPKLEKLPKIYYATRTHSQIAQASGLPLLWVAALRGPWVLPLALHTTSRPAHSPRLCCSE
jgi:hypothetical protein